MVPRVQRGLVAYVQELQSLRSWAGFDERATTSKACARSTAYRYRAGLTVVPSFTVERLGLSHVHLFIRQANECWLRFPYAVEHAWLTPNFVERTLYLHCIVPDNQYDAVVSLVTACRREGWCAGVTMLVAGGGWQQLLLAEHAPADMPPVLGEDAARLLRDHPLIVPVLFEAWGTQDSYARVWERIRQRMGDRLRSYVHGRLYRTNGKLHVAQAYATLQMAGLFRQYAVHYQGVIDESVELFLTVRRSRDWLPELLEALREDALAVEQYASVDGTALVRVLGGRELVERIVALQEELAQRHAAVYVRANQRAGERVRFCYELLFDPKTGNWQFPRVAIMERMRAGQ